MVVKLGGRALETPGAEREFARDASRLEGPMVLVHGGGGEVTAWCERLGLGARFEDGLRVTDLETLDVAAAVLAVLVNQRLVARLREAGLDAVGISAVSGGLAVLDPHPHTSRLGAVGTVTGVRAGVIHALLDGGFVPVVSSLGARDGALLNVNADELAGALAGALTARVLVMLTDVPGVRLGAERIGRLGLAEVSSVMASPQVQGGMIPKLAAASHAVRHGCGRTVIGAWSGPGTLERLLGPNPDATSILLDDDVRAASAGGAPAGSAAS